MTIFTSESNPTCSEDSTLEESMWHIMYFVIVHKTKGIYFGVAFGRIIYLNPTELTWILIFPPGSDFCLAESVVGTLSQLISTFIILDILYKNKPQNIRIIDEAKKRLVKITSGGFFTLVKLIFMAWNVLGMCAMSSWEEFLWYWFHVVDILLDL